MLALLVALSCQTPAPVPVPVPVSPSAISLAPRFSDAKLTGSPSETVAFPKLEWRFDDTGTLEPIDDAEGWTASHGLGKLARRDGRLVAKAEGSLSILTVKVPEGGLEDDLLGEVSLKIKVTAGARIGIYTASQDELDMEAIVERIEERDNVNLMKPLEPKDEVQTVTFTESDAPNNGSVGLGALKHFGIVVFDGKGGELELESMQIVPRAEYLARIEPGMSWQGLSGIYRETVVARSPERVTWTVKLGVDPWLDVAIGSPDLHPVSFVVDVSADGVEPLHLRRVVTTPKQWSDVALPLDAFAGKATRITLGLEAEDEGRVGFWGAPTVRHRMAPPTVAEPSPAREKLGPVAPPRGVIVLMVDTLRRDHLDAWGYERATAPTLSRLAGEGTRFSDNISQATWTKISVPAILTSLYPTSHGIVEIQHRIPASVTTMSEAYREAGYATFHTSSVFFSGRNSNLHQGVEVMHERDSIDGAPHKSKTARTYVDRLIPWLDTHHEQPFFVFLHVFDPHSAFRPEDPWDRRWMDDDGIAAHEDQLEKVGEVVDIFHGLPTAEDLEKAKVDPKAFVDAEHAWYDASIRAMDVEVDRLFAHLASLGIEDDVLFAFVSDHGEEFLEHGESWHGHSVYGEMINVPMAVRWPGVVPAGRVVDRTTQSIDLMPTLLELSLVETPEHTQGNSQVEGMASAPAGPGGTAYSELRHKADDPDKEEPEDDEDKDVHPDALVVVHDGWKLIWNIVLRDERPEFELFDHRADPLNLKEVASEHPDKVAALKALIEAWQERALAEKVASETGDLSDDEKEALKALGYLD